MWQAFLAALLGKGGAAAGAGAAGGASAGAGGAGTGGMMGGMAGGSMMGGAPPIKTASSQTTFRQAPEEGIKGATSGGWLGGDSPLKKMFAGESKDMTGYGESKDMSDFATLPKILAMANQVNRPSARRGQMPMNMNPYIRNLMGG